MVMYAVAEEQSLCIFRKCLELTAFAVSGIVLENILHCVPQLQVIAAVLVPEYVAAPLCGLREMVGVFFLLKAEFVPAGNLVAYNLCVGKLVNGVFETGTVGAASGCEHGGGDNHGHSNYVHINLNSFFKLVSGPDDMSVTPGAESVRDMPPKFSTSRRRRATAGAGSMKCTSGGAILRMSGSRKG